MAGKRRYRENPPSRIVGDRGVELLPTSRAAALMEISARTFTTLVAEGHLVPAGIIGNSNVYYRDEVLAVRKQLYGW